MKRTIVTRTGLAVVAALAVVATVLGFLVRTHSWPAYERRWRKAVAFAPEVKRLLQSDPAYRSLGSSAYQIVGPAEIKVMGTLESQAQLAHLKSQVAALDPPVPIDYDIIVTDLLRQGRRLAADLAEEGLPPTHWVINPETNGTFGLVFRDQQINGLHPLSGKPVYWLEFHNTAVRDLRPLQGLPLERLVFDADAVSDGIEIVRNMTALELINGLPANEFWKQYEEAEQAESTVPVKAAPSAPSTVR